MQSSQFKLTEIRIKNFKVHEELNISCTERVDIFGDNKQGKTSVLEALQFCLEGKKSDKDKIQQGKEEAEVSCTFVGDGGLPLEVTRKIDTEGKSKLKVLYDGISPQAPANFVKSLVGFGTFNPRELLNKEGREERLLNLLPIYIKKEELDKFPLTDTRIDFSDHAFKVLKQVEKDLKNTRLCLYQTKDLKLKALKKNTDAIDKEEIDLKKKYDDLKVNNIDSLLKEQGALEKELEGIKERKESLIKDLEKNKKRVEDHKVYRDSISSKINNNLDEIRSLSEDNRVLEENLKSVNNEGLNIAHDLEVTEEQIKKDGVSFVECIKSLSSIEKGTEKARDIQKLEVKRSDLLKDESEALNDEEAWREIDILIKKDFKEFRRSVLAPLTEKIPNFTIREDGQLLLNGIVLDQLCESETIELAVKFMSLDKKSRLIAIDGAESLDKKTIESVDWGKKDVLLIRVAESPIGEGWKSERIKKNDK